MKEINEKPIGINEEFMPIETARTFDSKNRISLGGRIKKILSKKMKVDGFQVLIGKDGDILLRPMANIPSREAWLYKNVSAYNQVREGLRDAKQGKTKKVNNVEEFLENL